MPRPGACSSGFNPAGAVQISGRQVERLVWEKRQEELLRSSLRSSLLYDFIFGKLVNAREIYEKCRLLGIGTIPDAVLVLQIDELPRRTINRSEWYTYELRERVCQALEKAVADIPDAMMAVAGSGRLVLLLAAPHPESAGVEYLKTVADSLRQQVRSDTDLTVSVGIGGIVEDARRLHGSYREALAALRHKFFTGLDSTLASQEMTGFSRQAEFRLEPGFLQALQLGDEESCQKRLEELLGRVRQQPAAEPELLKMQAFEFLGGLLRACRETGVEAAELSRLEYSLGQELNRLETMEGLAGWLRESTGRLSRLNRQHRNPHRARAVGEALRFIDAHYMEELILEDIAAHVCLSGNYLSNLFRQETGCTVGAYITRARMKKAREFLRNMEYTIADTAHLIGYRDPRYFCRVFRQEAGMTPSQYRK